MSLEILEYSLTNLPEDLLYLKEEILYDDNLYILEDLSKFQKDPFKYGRGYVKEYEESILDLEVDIPITESKKDEFGITQSEREEFYKIFGKSFDCSLAKDKNGYYVRTHRCRSKSYEKIKDIPKKSVDFVRSTS